VTLAHLATLTDLRTVMYAHNDPDLLPYVMGKPIDRTFHMSWASRIRPKPEILPEFMGRPVGPEIGSEIFPPKLDTIQRNEYDTILMSESLEVCMSGVYCSEDVPWRKNRNTIWMCLEVYICPEIFVLEICSGGMNTIPQRCV
jgi:hypothetical protein